MPQFRVQENPRAGDIIVAATGNDVEDDGGFTKLDAVARLIAFFGGWLYYALMESSPRKATLGKMALGIAVTDYDGKQITFAKATGRYFGKLISVVILLIGYLMVAWTEKKQGLHDIMAGTLVVNEKKS
ncbi:MAG: RDD family protein [Chloroflexi bacterium]|nr:RDD family protein [Chloroflexota bacterium]